MLIYYIYMRTMYNYYVKKKCRSVNEYMKDENEK